MHYKISGQLLLVQSLLLVCNTSRDTNSTKLLRDIHSEQRFWTLRTAEDIQRVSVGDEKLYQVLRERLPEIEQELKHINRFLIQAYKLKWSQNFEKQRTLLEKFQQVTRMWEVEKLRKFLKSKSYLDSEAKFNAIFNATFGSGHFSTIRIPTFPTWEDMYMSHRAILNFHEFHFFTPAQLSQGVRIDTLSGGRLKASHAFIMGVHALTAEMYYVAVEWLEYVRMLILQNDFSADLHIVQQLLNLAISEHNLAKWEKMEVTGGRKNYYDLHYQNTYLNLTYDGQPYFQRGKGRVEYFHRFSPSYKNDSRLNFLRLCSSLDFQEEKVRSNLKCYLERNQHPYLILNALKVEQLSVSPVILQVYNVLGNETIREIKKFSSEPQMYNSTPWNVNVDEVDVRTTMRFRWWAGAGSLILNDKLNDLIAERSELITGLVSREEAVQIMRYCYGRYYPKHSDEISLPPEDKFVARDGPRVASVLFYIEVPAVGGSTPFTEAGISAKPVHGSAVIWINMFKNGTSRKDVGHGSCPVIHGNKQALNVFIRYNPNFLNYKCSLNWDE